MGVNEMKSLPCVSDLAVDYENEREAENDARIALLEQVSDAALNGEGVWVELLEYMLEDDRLIEMFNMLRRASVEKPSAELHEKVGADVLKMFDDIFDRMVEDKIDDLERYV